MKIVIDGQEFELEGMNTKEDPATSFEQVALLRNEDPACIIGAYRLAIRSRQLSEFVSFSDWLRDDLAAAGMDPEVVDWSAVARSIVKAANTAATQRLAARQAAGF